MRWLGVMGCLAFLLLGVFVTSTQETTDTLLTSAEDAYDRGDYAAAINQYLALLDGGIANADLYFNLGSVYYEAGRLGQALAHYLRAQAITPRDTTLQQQIETIRAERVDYQRDSVNLLDRLADSTRGILNMRELAVIGFIAWVVACGSGIGWLLRRTHTIRNTAIMLGVIALFINGLLFVRLHGLGQRTPAVIAAPSVTVMSGPGTDYLEIYTLYAAAELRILETRDLWVRFTLPDGRQGWLPRDVLITI